MIAAVSREASGADRQLAFSTLSFTLCFAAWGLIAAFAPSLRVELSLTATATAIVVAVPVLLGSLGRIPMGILTDRYGARVIFPLLFLVAALAAALTPLARTFETLLVAGFALGIAGSSFAVGVGHVSRWFPPAKQGAKLGIYGLGNIGQSAAVFGGPLVAGVVGRDNVFYGIAGLLAIWSVVFALLGRDAPGRSSSRGLGPITQVLTHDSLSWLLSLFYFVTFGGFVAFSIYLPSLLKDDFHLTAADAGFRTAGFVVLATLLRPLGGALSDKIGGARVLSGVFLGIVPFALLLAWSSTIPFTVGALGCAALLGLGNGAVFKLVPQFFPVNTGAVTGLVGAMGGLGGFFPPIILGQFRDRLGVAWPGFMLLAATSLAMWLLNRRVFIPRQHTLELALVPELARAAERLRAFAWAGMVTALLSASIVVGSRNLQDFDAALVVYTFAVIFATFGAVYHYVVWLQKPPTRLYWRRSLQLLGSPGALRLLAGRFATHVVAQNFIRRRSWQRWWMHQLIMWGCLLAVAITFPLVFGWIHFTSAPGDQMTYITYLFGFPAGSFHVRTVLSWVLFHGLDFSAVLVLAGIGLSLWRRMRDQGALALQSFAMDFFPLILLFAICVTGFALTASSLWLRGAFYPFLAILHALTVIGALLYLPFGKFFHIFQRPAQLGVKLYQDAGAKDQGANCARCGQRFASRMHIDDLRQVLPQLGFDYSIAGQAQHWQALCPACKRKTLAYAQLRLKGSHGETT